ncbi:hypothetical protein [Streptomyces sp. NPDC020607]|uniref:hypothetical protein n=1 Tax=Streptomyces sp. NPDC020607 TaxID=3365082 RepID=UPI0037B11D9F
MAEQGSRGRLSSDLELGELYRLALEVAAEHGAYISSAAKHVGRYDFIQRVRSERKLT